MRVTYLLPTLDETRAQLHLDPESDRDIKTCERLIADGLASGCGYDPETGLVMHMQITL